MDRKYILTDETKEIRGHILHRIQAVRDFGDVKAGELGGFIESEENLSHQYQCWISDDATVYGNARVYYNALVAVNASLFDNALVLDNVLISGNAIMGGDSIASGKARIFNGAKVLENAKVHNCSIYENAVIGGYARIDDECTVRGHAHVEGNARILNGATVHGYAYVDGNAHILNGATVCGHTRLSGNARIFRSINSTDNYICLGPIGSRDDCTTFISDNGRIFVATGCFTGTLDEFKTAVYVSHHGSKYEKEYKQAIKFAKKQFELRTRR